MEEPVTAIATSPFASARAGQLLDAKKQAEKYMERVLTANDDVKSKFETQYTSEIQELKDRQTKEM